MTTKRPVFEGAQAPGSAPVGGADHPVVEDLELTPVTAHGWRVTDGRLPLRDPHRLLAFVERRGDVFEVMQLGAGFEWHEFESLEAAIMFVCATGPRYARARSQGELAWIA